MKAPQWYTLKNPEEQISPSLLVYPERIEANIKTMLAMIGEVERLRPHIKTHKMAEIVQMQMAHGISKFKCATIAEAELLGVCKAADVLLAMQPVGANIQRFLELLKAFPETRFSTLVDNEKSIEAIATAASKEGQVGLFLDLNTGMNRTGVIPDERALLLYKKIYENPHCLARGLHAYDGHIRNEELQERKEVCDKAFNAVIDLKASIEARGMEVPTVVAGGSPSFPIHAKRKGVEASPGTTLLWDERYGQLFKDMPFVPAAVLFTRIVSKPKEGIICLDLGHKAIAPEMDFPRVKLFGLEKSTQLGQSEEHLVVQYNEAEGCNIGDEFYAIPMHICPTVAKYASVSAVSKGTITATWNVAARDHKITI